MSDRVPSLGGGHVKPESILNELRRWFCREEVPLAPGLAVRCTLRAGHGGAHVALIPERRVPKWGPTVRWADGTDGVV